MKVIDLLNKIANGEEVPFEIKLFGVTFCFNNEKQCYFSKYDEGNILDMHSHLLRNKNKSLLNEEVEIIEDTPKEDKKIEELKQRIDKAIELLEKENYHCPMSLTVEKAYIIEVEKINNVISILRGEDNERV